MCVHMHVCCVDKSVFVCFGECVDVRLCVHIYGCMGVCRRGLLSELCGCTRLKLLSDGADQDDIELVSVFR